MLYIGRARKTPILPAALAPRRMHPKIKTKYQDRPIMQYYFKIWSVVYGTGSNFVWDKKVLRKLHCNFFLLWSLIRYHRTCNDRDEFTLYYNITCNSVYAPANPLVDTQLHSTWWDTPLADHVLNITKLTKSFYTDHIVISCRHWCGKWYISLDQSNFVLFYLCSLTKQTATIVI